MGTQQVAWRFDGNFIVNAEKRDEIYSPTTSQVPDGLAGRAKITVWHERSNTQLERTLFQTNFITSRDDMLVAISNLELHPILLKRTLK